MMALPTPCCRVSGACQTSARACSGQQPSASLIGKNTSGRQLHVQSVTLVGMQNSQHRVTSSGAASSRRSHSTIVAASGDSQDAGADVKQCVLGFPMLRTLAPRAAVTFARTFA